MPDVLVAEHVSKAFSTPNGLETVQALQDVSLAVQENEFVSIVGPSGCGKSTLLSIFGGFEQPTGGSVRLGSDPIDGPSADRGFVFQSDALFHWLTVEQNVAYGPRVQGYPSAKRREIVERSLQLVGLTRFRTATPRQLSGGMRQRVAIARALATNPRILLLDEPFGALDVLTRKRMQDELARIWDQTHKTVVLVTHAIDEALLLSDRVFVMTKSPGRIARALAIDLPRPRSVRDARFRELELSITEFIMSDLGEDA
jgi:ABC-type nitrate/sulfonate/bicarbonate transport system ATPase subunit